MIGRKKFYAKYLKKQVTVRLGTAYSYCVLSDVYCV